ncbi:DPP IV N-terminal domain-containing protein [Niabella ginsengisoli]|uniref:DPP IV N-terminal domain-containing protein n=2 Tax=Niabella ginsengisoli TaxID=522298 RepID=A0ABS9SFW6_9BACT|nr:DPP IV N-terminal domain-containing protein [Niabella ginsengisoli]MCH5597256.1 DPP IV N-terminal domain-containing protein [Niabella ginsengisoli]
MLSSNLYSWDINSGETQQLTNIGTTSNNFGAKQNGGKEEQWLRNDQLQNFDVLRERKAKNDTSNAYKKALPKEKALRYLFVREGSVRGLSISPDGRFVSYRAFKPVSTRNTIIPDYVTETGYTTDISGRNKVGAEQGISSFYIFDRERDSVLTLPIDAIPGIKDLPDYLKDYPVAFDKKKKENANRAVSVYGISWSPKGKNAVIDIYADDNKDRWLMLWDMNSNQLTLLSRQRNEAWIGGPGINSNSIGWISEDIFWFQSEATGYSHLYTINIKTKEKTQLTSGEYELHDAILSENKKTFLSLPMKFIPGKNISTVWILQVVKRKRLLR